MKISEARKKLEEFEKEVGDVELICMTAVDGEFFTEFGRALDIVTIPDENGKEEGPYVGLLNFDDDSVESE